jgi:hypothetical protein
MRTVMITAAIVASAAMPLRAEQSQAYFSQAVDICLNFSPDAFLVVDRLEEKGWIARWDDYYETTILTTPGNSVWVLPPPEDSELPSVCRVISQSVGIVQAEAAVQFVLSDNGFSYQEGVVHGCSALDVSNGNQIRIFSDGQDDFCNDPDSSRVDIETFVDPVAGQ